jgi:hypothetical protein
VEGTGPNRFKVLPQHLFGNNKEAKPTENKAGVRFYRNYKKRNFLRNIAAYNVGIRCGKTATSVP